MGFATTTRDSTGLYWNEITPEIAYSLRDHHVRSSPWLDPDQVVIHHGGKFVVVREMTTEKALQRLGELGDLYLPPDHRETIAERLGCADRPEEFWHQSFVEPKGNPATWPHHCKCHEIVVTLRRIAILDGPPLSLIEMIYYAGLCESPDGLSGCGKVWWTRRESPPTFEAGTRIEPGEAVYVGSDGRVYPVGQVPTT